MRNASRRCCPSSKYFSLLRTPIVITPGSTPPSCLICSASACTFAFNRSGRWNGGLSQDLSNSGVTRIVSTAEWVTRLGVTLGAVREMGTTSGAGIGLLAGFSLGRSERTVLELEVELLGRLGFRDDTARDEVSGGFFRIEF